MSVAIAVTSKSTNTSKTDLKTKLSDASTLPDLSDSSSSESSDVGSDSDSSSNVSDSDSDSEFGEVSQEYLDSLLEKAKASMRAKAQEKAKQRAFGEEEEIRLNDEREKNGVSTRLPQLDPGELPLGYFDFKDGDKKSLPTLRDIDAERLSTLASSSAPAAPPAPPELAKDGRQLTKKEKKALKKRTTGPQWFDLSAPDAADLPRLHREVEALRLRNALDPKRFYRKEPGEGKGIKGLPEHFAIGTIVTTKTPFGTTSGENLTRAERKRTLVDELVEDSEAKRYAKRKFEDLQTVRGARGRGTFAKRFGARKSKW